MFIISKQASQAAVPLSHTWVASNGSDSNDCDCLTPCRSFGGAFAKTVAGGEITCVDAGNYTSFFIIDKSITIDCEAATGKTLGAIQINTAGSDVVTLRGLHHDGENASVSPPINFSGAGVLHLDKIKISKVRGTGVAFHAMGASKLFVSDCHLTDIGSTSTHAGINISAASGATANITIERTRIENNFFGIVATSNSGSIRGVVRDSVVSGNVHNGITVSTSGAGTAVLLVERATVSGNDFGLAAGGANSTGMLVSQSSIVLNNTGLFTTGGAVLLSYKNNNLNGNATTDGTFSGPIAQQ